MKTFIPFATAAPRTRAVLAGAAFATAASVMLAVVVAFGAVSSEPFLRDTPAARLAVARCEALGERQAREGCVRRLVAAAKASDAGGARVAAIEAPQPRR